MSRRPAETAHPDVPAVAPVVAPRLVLAQLLASLLDGVALSTIVLHVTLHLGFPAPLTGLVMAAAAAVALVLAVPLGTLADRVGLRRAGVGFTVLMALSLLGFVLTGSVVAFAVSITLFAVAQSASTAVRQGLAVSAAAPSARVGVRAVMHTWVNVGVGAGTALGALLAWAGGGGTFRAAYAVAALGSLGAAVVLSRLPGTAPRSRPSVGTWALLRADRVFARATALASVVQLTMPVLSVLLPVWVVRRTDAPVWAAGAAFALNTVLVMLTQRRWSARLRGPGDAARSAVLAALALLVAGALLAASAASSTPWLAVVVLGAGVVALTAGEVCGGAATWSVALGRVPDGAEGRYQSAFSMATSTARIVGPGVALPLVLGLGTAGWLLLAVVMASACLGIAGLSRTVEV